MTKTQHVPLVLLTQNFHHYFKDGRSQNALRRSHRQTFSGSQLTISILRIIIVDGVDILIRNPNYRK